MELLANFAQAFIGVFQTGGETFVGLLTGIVPTLVCLMTAVNALVKFVGEDRVNRWGESASRVAPLRYTVMPVMAVFFLTNPMAYTFGRFLPEKYKPAFYDAAVSFVHPILGLFPHANPAELFVYMGIAQGIQQLGLPVGELAIRYFIVGVIVILIRGMVTERLTLRMAKQQGIEL
ncbi:MAG: glucitol/sorbitol system component [Synergistaceae bacterium]|jgi:PTS system glucitol/sorbitol-specific IIC component|nr:glucitol/sorbitol system component [Synergistaceae bacterium]HOA76413.1 PTS glucitol/sorbitol transporter subunit IIC [Thermosynergistes sp.]HPU77178.1 PTS glucitol/sorbitol transporter subunit IIC [Thermosynergistes sp.]HPZ76178.1 PTS glucitol/sorbitol transporter subunit IIC [Thermosynergistes sp.]HQE20661.1 PTS glucitol/sorbitol transporter subunit IIC [Thermosynergistes sp.]